MRYLSFRDVLTAMSEHAQYNWCKWALKGALFSGHLMGYTQSGKVGSFAYAASLRNGENSDTRLWRDRYAPVPSEIERDYDITLPEYSNMEWDERVPVYEWEWNCSEDPNSMAPGYFLWGDTDWLKSSLRLSNFQIENGWKDLFSNDHIFEDSPDLRLHYDIELDGLCFELEQIASFAPNINFDSLAGQSDTTIGGVGGSAGRPRKWDWTGAMIQITALANTPDGLPSGQGAQAKIERLMADWFVSTTGNQPATSQLRTHAQKVISILGLN